jgi:hypothetical protein
MAADRLLWVCLSRIWTEWRSAIVIVRPESSRGTGVRSAGLDVEEWSPHQRRRVVHVAVTEHPTACMVRKHEIRVR